MSLDAIFEHCVDIAFLRTGKAAEFLLCNHVILRTAQSRGERAISQSMFFRSFAACSLCNEKGCRLNAARPVHGSN